MVFHSRSNYEYYFIIKELAKEFEGQFSCLEGIKSLLSNSSKFMQLFTDEDNWIKYFINLESKLKDCFKVLKNDKKCLIKDLIAVAEEVVNYDHNIFMASLDLESVSTNILLEETIKNCVKDLFFNNF